MHAFAQLQNLGSDQSHAGWCKNWASRAFDHGPHGHQLHSLPGPWAIAGDFHDALQAFSFVDQAAKNTEKVLGQNVSEAPEIREWEFVLGI